MTYHNIDIPKEKIEDFCRRNHIARLSLYGSILRDDFGPNSDIDLLVEFEPGRVPGLFTMAGLEIELTEILGRKVDFRTARDLSRYFRDEVVSTAETVCEREG